MPLQLVRVKRNEVKNESLFWGSIFSGAFLTLGSITFFLLLGRAIGLGISSVAGAPGGGNVLWSFIYTAVTLVFSYFLGSYLANRTADIGRAGSGSLHGFTSWGLATTILAMVTLGVAARMPTVGTTVMSNNTVLWLGICVIGGGAIFSVIGGALGKVSASDRGEEVIEERRVA